MVEFDVWKRGSENSNSVEKSNINEVFEFLNNNSEIECDTETSGFDPHTKDILCIQFGNQTNQYLIKWNKELVYLLAPYFNSNKLFIFQNAKFDLQFLYKYGIIVNKVYDTFLAECILTCGTLTRRDLKSLISKYLKINISKEIRESIPKLGLTLDVINYGLDDVKYLSLVKEEQMKLIKEYDLEPALRLDNRFVQVLAYIEYCGIYFDSKLWSKNIEDNIKTSEELLTKMNTMIVELGLKKFYNYADLFCKSPVFKDGVAYETTINWSSSRQVVSLFKALGIDVSIEEDGEIKESVGKQVLQEKENEHEIVKLYSKFIKNNKLLTSFGKSYFDYINPKTNRIHTTYKQILNTGRMSSGNKRDNKPNLQQLPSDSRYRKCFIPEKGNIMIAADYTGMESVVFANKTLDKGLLEFYDKNLGDMHSFVAKMCFPEELKEVALEDVKNVRKDLRQNAKAAGFAIQFGGVGFTISNNLGVSPEIGDQVYEAYMNGFPGVKDYFDKVFKETLENGYITFNDITKRKSFFDFFDRFRKLQTDMDNMDWKKYREEKNKNSYLFTNKYQPIVKDYFKLKGIIERKSYNFPVQGSSADITKVALLLIWDYIIKNKLFNILKICNVVHDEIIVECPLNIQKEVTEVVYNSMIKAGSLFFTRVKLDAVAEAGDHWIH